MKAIFSLLLFFLTTSVFCQADSLNVEDRIEFVFLDSVMNNHDRNQFLFLADSSGHKIFVEKKYFDNYVNSGDHTPYTLIELDEKKQKKMGGYKFIVHIPQGGLSERDYKDLYAILQDESETRE